MIAKTTTETATITDTVVFERLTLTQAKDGTYSAELQYRKVRRLGDSEISCQPLNTITLDQEALLNSPEGQQAFPLIQAFCRKAQAAVTPELFQ